MSKISIIIKQFGKHLVLEGQTCRKLSMNFKKTCKSVTFYFMIGRDALIPIPGIGIGWIGAKKGVSVVEHEYWYR